MNPTEELTGLVRRLIETNAQRTQPDRDVIADWISDHPEMAGELVAALLRKLPDVMLPILQENLAVSLVPLIAWSEASRRVVGLDIRLSWCGKVICFSHVDL